MRRILLYLTMAVVATNASAKKVYGPRVEGGGAEIAYFLDHNGDGNVRHQFEVEYGITDHWLTAVYADYRQTGGADVSFHGLKWENIYEFGTGVGLYVEYFRPQKSLHSADELELKLLLESATGPLVHTANFGVTKEVGSGANGATGSVYAWRTRWKRLALEFYGSPSAGIHQAGPVVSGDLTGGFDLEVGYLMGLDAASADGALKFILAREF